MTQSSITEKVLRILDENSARKIRFHLGPVGRCLTISSDELDRVAYAIRKGTIKVVHDPNLHEGYAKYDNYTITLKSAEFGGRYEQTNASKLERSYVIHEATHAAVHLVKATSTRKLTNEAAAYLAQALYLYQELGDTAYRHIIDKQLVSEEMRRTKDIHRACLSLIEKYNLLTRNAYLADPNYKPLLHAVKKSYEKIGWTDTEGSSGAPQPRPGRPPKGSVRQPTAAVPSIHHKIRFGDRVWYLAEDYGYTDRKRFTQEVAKLNPGIDFRKLLPGQTIRVPTKVGVPKTLSAPYALRQQLGYRPPASAPFGSVQPSALRVLDRHFRRSEQMAGARQSTTLPAFDTLTTLRRLEREATQLQATRRWLSGIERQFGHQSPLGAPTRGAQPSQWRLLGQHLWHS
jgi:hypothetical protein